MIKSLKIKNFKHFNEFEINDLSLVTLISGKNNVGKSSLLEALYLLIEHSRPNVFVRLNNFRKSPSLRNVSIWENLFYNFNSDNVINISAINNDEKIEISYKKDNTYVPINKDNIEDNIFDRFKASAENNYSLKYEFKMNDYIETNNVIVGEDGFLNNIKTTEKDNSIKSICKIYMSNYENTRVDSEILV